jgi:hypothetical protein
MYPVLFTISPLTIYSLGLFWTLGALAAAWIFRLELKRYGYDPEVAGSVVFAAVIADYSVPGCFLFWRNGKTLDKRRFNSFSVAPVSAGMEDCLPGR